MLACARVRENPGGSQWWTTTWRVKHEISFCLVIIYVTVKATRWDTVAFFFFKGGISSSSLKGTWSRWGFFFFSKKKKEVGWLVQKLSPKEPEQQINNEHKSSWDLLFSAKRRGRDNQSFDYFVKSMQMGLKFQSRESPRHFKTLLGDF